MQENLNEQPEAPFKERKGWLTFFGIVEILLGGFCLIFAAFSLLGMLMASQSREFMAAGAKPSSMITIFVLYLLISILFIWLGIGSIGFKRWARSLSLLVGWYWLIPGIIMFIFFLFFFPGSLGQLPVQDEQQAVILKIILGIVLVFFFLFFILLPAAFILFYRSRNVKMTVEKYDPVARWTDKAPLPVIALSITFSYMGLYLFSLISYNWMMPFFGILLDGTAGMLFVLGNIALCFYLGFRLFQLKTNALKLAIAYWAIMIISFLLTFRQYDIFDMYSRFGMPQETIAQVRYMFPSLNSTILFLVFGGIVFAAGYFWYVRRFFSTSGEE